MIRITPFLWFDADAEAAAEFYLATFPGSRRVKELRMPGSAPASLLAVDLELAGQSITLLNGGPDHPLTDAFSLVVRCETQEEIDWYWSTLAAGGTEGRCGWLKDKFGLSWQIVPVQLSSLLRHPASMRAMMSMNKLDIRALEIAALQPSSPQPMLAG